jgi:hypothetical protein
LKKKTDSLNRESVLLKKKTDSLNRGSVLLKKKTDSLNRERMIVAAAHNGISKQKREKNRERMMIDAGYLNRERMVIEYSSGGSLGSGSSDSKQVSFFPCRFYYQPYTLNSTS